jgi:hypothetical protein
MKKKWAMRMREIIPGVYSGSKKASEEDKKAVEYAKLAVGNLNKAAKRIRDESFDCDRDACLTVRSTDV